jgi:hypothetical protein
MGTPLERRHLARRPVAIASLALLAAVGIASLARAARNETIVRVRGQVTDASGAPVPGHTVRLIKTRTVYKMKAPRSQAQMAEETRVRTDAEGAFEFQFPLDPAFHAYFVRFYDPALFDSVKYVVPKDAEISRLVEKGIAIEARTVLQMNPDWPQVRALVEEYGAASNRGQILRSLGLPKMKEPLEEGRELWVFDAAGISYVIEGDKVVETRKSDTAPRRGEPVPASSSGAAERVDDP